MALGYLGTFFLPLGGGELIKIGTLRMLLGMPGAAAVAGVFLDRLFDLLGLALLLGALAGTGVAVQFRAGPLWTGALAASALALVLGIFLFLRRQALRRGAAPARREASWVGQMLGHFAEVLCRLRRPADLGRLLAAQAAVSVLDVAAIHVGLQAFTFGPSLHFMVSAKLSAYFMLGAALPLLPGGSGTFQVACLLALQPAGVSSAGAFAYSLVAQGTGFALFSCFGTAAALWPRTGGADLADGSA
jgi:hypothetical protein